MAKKEFKIIEGDVLINCRKCRFCQTISKNSEVYYCKEFNFPIFDFSSFPKVCEFESIFKTMRKGG
jgi:hypothetical protein